MDPAVVGGLIGIGTLASMYMIVYVCERIYKPPSNRVVIKPKSHWKMKNLLPVYNEEESRAESYPLREGVYIELNHQPSIRSHILRVSRGSDIVSSETNISKV